MKYKNRLTFAYYSITFWDIKNLQSVPKTWKVLKSKNKFFKKMFKYRNTVCYDFKSRFLVIFSRNYRHHLVLKIPFPDHIFPKISKYRTENLHFPSTVKYYATHPTHPRRCSSFMMKWLSQFDPLRKTKGIFLSIFNLKLHILRATPL